MYSRAHLLIELEQEKLLTDPPWGIEAWPLKDDNIFEWMAKIKGLRNTPWEDGIFTVYIKFDEHYNVRPPTVFFQTIPFHPNVDMTSGKPCVDFLDNCHVWNEDYSLSMILVTLQTLLANPVYENAVNVDAARMLMTSPDLYDQITKECVANSQAVEARGANALLVPDEPAVAVHKPPPADKAHVAPSQARSFHTNKLSFEEYHRAWLSIATSKPEPNAVNLMMDSIKNKSDPQKIHLSLSKDEEEQVTPKQLQAYNRLACGSTKSRWESEKNSKLEKLNRMKQIYLPCQQSAVTEIGNGNAGKTGVRLQTKADISEEDVDDLVKWSHNLDSSFLEQS